MSRHKIIGPVLVGLLALTACGGGSFAQSGPKSLRMTVWTANEAHLKLLNEIAAANKASHPDVTEIKFDSIPADNYSPFGLFVNTSLVKDAPENWTWNQAIAAAKGAAAPGKARLVLPDFKYQTWAVGDLAWVGARRVECRRPHL